MKRTLIYRIIFGAFFTGLFCLWTPWAGMTYALLWAIANEWGSWVYAKNFHAQMQEIKDFLKS